MFILNYEVALPVQRSAARARDAEEGQGVGVCVLVCRRLGLQDVHAAALRPPRGLAGARRLPGRGDCGRVRHGHQCGLWGDARDARCP